MKPNGMDVGFVVFVVASAVKEEQQQESVNKSRARRWL